MHALNHLTLVYSLLSHSWIYTFAVTQALHISHAANRLG